MRPKRFYDRVGGVFQLLEMRQSKRRWLSMVFRTWLMWFGYVEYIVGLQAVLQKTRLSKLGLIDICE